MFLLLQCILLDVLILKNLFHSFLCSLHHDFHFSRKASDALDRQNAIFDESGNFLLYCTMLGVKVVNLVTNKLVRLLGRHENVRFLQATLFQVRRANLYRSSNLIPIKQPCARQATLFGACILIPGKRPFTRQTHFYYREATLCWGRNLMPGK